MATPELTPDEYGNWLPPSAAVKILESVFGTDTRSYIAKHTLLERLRGGIVRAAAKRFVIDDRLQSERAIIESATFQNLQENDIFWTSSDLTFSVIDEWRRREFHRYYHVRFESAAVNEIANNATANPSTNAAPEAEQKGPSVAPANLQAWYTFYKSVTKPSEDTEDYAWLHAKRCFPNNTVSRDSVRTLRGSQKRGPKKQSDLAE